jgi:hypothetical protein
MVVTNGWALTVNTGQLARRSGGKPQTQEFKKQTSYWMDSNNSAPRLTNGSSSSAGMHTPTPTPPPAPISTPALDKDKGKEVTPSARVSSPAPRVDKGKAREVNPANPFSPSSDSRRMSLTEDILSPETAAAAQRRRDARTGMGGGPFGSGNNNDLLSNLLGGMGGMGGRTLRAFASYTFAILLSHSIALSLVLRYFFSQMYVIALQPVSIIYD